MYCFILCVDNGGSLSSVVECAQSTEHVQNVNDVFLAGGGLHISNVTFDYDDELTVGMPTRVTCDHVHISIDTSPWKSFYIGVFIGVIGASIVNVALAVMS